MNRVIIQAKDFVDPRGLILESAERLANEVAARLKGGSDIEISLSELKGASSSYFNVLLLRLIEVFGANEIRNRVTFQFRTIAQQQVFQRSLDSIAKSPA